MANLDVNTATTTNTVDNFVNYSVDPVALDTVSEDGDTTWEYPEATKNFGYYKTIPELKKAIDSLAIWVAGKGFETDIDTQKILEHIQGWGEDSFQAICENLIVTKKIVGDSFAEIIRDEKTKTIINLKPISPERMKVVVGKNGLIKRYEHKTSTGWTKLKKEEVLHLCNDRIGDEIHGVSVIDACKWVIDARNEAMADYRKVLHRNVVPVRIIEIDSDDTIKRDALIREYESAIQKGEVLVIPKGTVSIVDNKINIQDPIAWISYLENFFYQAVGVPRVIASSSEYSEASSKIGYLTFEPIYTREQTLLESDLWNKLNVRVKFNRPVSLGSTMQESEQKNTGQTGFQPNDVQAGVGA